MSSSTPSLCSSLNLRYPSFATSVIKGYAICIILILKAVTCRYFYWNISRYHILWHNTLNVNKQTLHDNLHAYSKWIFIYIYIYFFFSPFSWMCICRLRLHTESLLTSLLITATSAQIGNWITPNPKRTQPAAERKHMIVFVYLRTWSIVCLHYVTGLRV